MKEVIDIPVGKAGAMIRNKTFKHTGEMFASALQRICIVHKELDQ